MTDEIVSRQIRNLSDTGIKIEIADKEILGIDYLNDNWKNTEDSSIHVKEIKNDQSEHFYHDERLKPEKCSYSNLYSYDTTMSKNISHSVKCNYQTANVTNILDSTFIQFGEKLSTPDNKFKIAKYPHLIQEIDERFDTGDKYFQYTEVDFKTRHANTTCDGIRTKDKCLEYTKCDFKAKLNIVIHRRTYVGENSSEFMDRDCKSAQKQNRSYQRTHSEEKPFECTECDFKTTYKQSLLTHKRTHSTEKPFECTECGFKTAHKKSLVEHKRTHNKEKPFQCIECSFKTAQKRNLLNHTRCHLEDKPFECTECDFKTAYKAYLVKHKRTHSGEKLLECAICGFRTAYKGNLVGHMRNHAGKKPFECMECDYKTAVKGSLLRHKRTHSEEKPLQCTECDFKTAYKANLVKHKRTHSGEKLLECAECDFRTAYKGNLVGHIRIHTGKKPFGCMECGFKTTQKGNLLSHKRTHSEEKHFECTVCNFKTGQRANWLVHKRIHIEEKTSDITENSILETTQQNDVILQKQIEDMDDSRDILEVERCTEEVKLEISESQLLIDNQLMNMCDIKTEPM